jgi:hypothetical protein
VKSGNSSGPVLDDGVDREAPRGKSVLGKFPDGPEIGRAKKSDPVVAAPVEPAVAGFLEAESGKPGPGRQLAGGRVRRHLEIARVVLDLAGRPTLHDVHADRLLEEAAEMKERDREAARPILEEGQVGLVAEPAMLVVIDPEQHIRLRRDRSRIGPGRQVPHPRPQGIERERNRIAEGQA